MRHDRAFGGAPEMSLHLIRLTDKSSGLLSGRATTGAFFKAHQSNKLFSCRVPWL